MGGGGIMYRILMDKLLGMLPVDWRRQEHKNYGDK
jgi:hypothetical protein